MRTTYADQAQWEATVHEDYAYVLAKDSKLPNALLEVKPACDRLWISGNAALLERGPRIGIIGSRTPRGEAIEAAYRIAFGAARAGFVIVSGLALGIDGIAHRAALDAGGVTIGVLACGLARVRPATNCNLASDMTQLPVARGVLCGHNPKARGLLITEYGPGNEQAYGYRYVARNRIIAALSDYLVVVQAGLKSGSMSTCEYALQLGVQIGVYPSAPEDPFHAGTTQLLSEGADAVVDLDSLMHRLELHNIMQKGATEAIRKGAVVDPSIRGSWLTVPAQTNEKQILDQGADPLMAHLKVPRTLDELSLAHKGESLASLRGKLLDLEDKGWIRRLDDGTWSSNL